MKNGEFKHPVVIWEVKNGDLKEPLRGHDAREMHLETNAPPGIHDFLIECSEDRGTFHGIVVGDNGRFDPVLTAHAIYIAQAKLESPMVHHVFIEEISWDPGSRRFLVGMGS